MYQPSLPGSSMRFTLPPDAEWIGKDSMTRRVKRIRYCIRVLYDNDKMVSTHALTSHDPFSVVPAGYLEIERAKTYYGEPKEVPSS